VISIIVKYNTVKSKEDLVGKICFSNHLNSEIVWKRIGETKVIN
jgi:hypothetical protein